MTDEEREVMLQLLANYDSMARSFERVLEKVPVEAPADMRTLRHVALIEDMKHWVPIWRDYSASIRTRFLLERRSSPRREYESDEESGAIQF